MLKSTNKFGKVKNSQEIKISVQVNISARTNIKKNEKITHENISVLRPKIGSLWHHNILKLLRKN